MEGIWHFMFFGRLKDGTYTVLDVDEEMVNQSLDEILSMFWGKRA